MGLVSLVRSYWALSYAALSVAGLLLTGVAITGVPAKNRKVAIVLTLLSNHMSELPWTVVLMNLAFSLWLSITGTTNASALVRFFNFVNFITAAGLAYLFKRSIDSKEAVDAFLEQLSKESKTRVELPGPNSPRFWSQFLNPIHWTRNYTLYESIPYWVSTEMFPILRSEGREAVQLMTLDVYKPNKVHAGDHRPVFVYIHGGGWTSGSKKWMGPLLTELLSREWVVVSVDYRLAPTSKYPAQLIDCKRALRWIKDEIQIFGGCPEQIVVGGDSSGGNLAALLALTPNLPEFQPGFESVDTTVQGCVPQSAPLDLTDVMNYSQYDARTRFIKEVAQREGSAKSADNLKFLTEHSPLFRIKESAVPFLVVHGDHDSFTPVEGARDFVHEFKKKAPSSTINYLEVPGGHHGFHTFPSPRSWFTVIAIAEWLSFHFDRHGPGKHVAEGEAKPKIPVHELVEWGWPKED
ncbi:hypothetical protein BGX34_010498 [Mortierella sp. NVP85]|nr:hypothetical protein BGX34_010498 [Mortierella sp. NVP85]